MTNSFRDCTDLVQYFWLVIVFRIFQMTINWTGCEYWQHQVIDSQPFYHMGLAARKPVIGVSYKARLKPVSSATGTSYKVEILLEASLDMILSNEQKQRRWSDCTYAQAGLRFCCSQPPEDKFSCVEAHVGPDNHNAWTWNCEYFLIHGFKHLFWVLTTYVLVKK